MKVNKVDTIYILYTKNHFKLNDDINEIRGLQNLNANLCGWNNELIDNTQLIHIASRLLEIIVLYDKGNDLKVFIHNLHNTIFNNGDIESVIKFYMYHLRWLEISKLDLYKLSDNDIDNIKLSVNGTNNFKLQ